MKSMGQRKTEVRLFDICVVRSMKWRYTRAWSGLWTWSLVRHLETCTSVFGRVVDIFIDTYGRVVDIFIDTGGEHIYRHVWTGDGHIYRHVWTGGGRIYRHIWTGGGHIYRHVWTGARKPHTGPIYTHKNRIN